MIQELYEAYPEHFFEYLEKIVDGYFGNLFITYNNEKILYCNKHLADSVHMTREEILSLSLPQLREKKLWLRSLSEEMYRDGEKAFDAYNVTQDGQELFTHTEPIFDRQGRMIMSAQYSIPKKMLTYFSSYINTQKSHYEIYKNIADFLGTQIEANNTPGNIICESEKSKKVFNNAGYFAGIDGTVLINGETGTGKDVIANFIYQNSIRRDQPFIPVNCSAIPSELMESEFFGYEKGAFTGARSTGKPGLFEMADHGTLFLDEIGELPLPMQAKLLRVLESGELMRIGGTRQIKTDVRILAATNRDLIEMIKEKRFREDLFYRLNVMHLFIPPLRERTEDILPLAKVFLEHYNRRYGLNRILSEPQEAALLSYKYPGNIRELRNLIERFTITGILDVNKSEASKSSPLPAYGNQNDFYIDPDTPLHQAVKEFEQYYIRQALKENNDNVTAAARKLGIHRSLLYKKLH